METEKGNEVKTVISLRRIAHFPSIVGQGCSDLRRFLLVEMNNLWTKSLIILECNDSWEKMPLFVRRPRTRKSTQIKSSLQKENLPTDLRNSQVGSQVAKSRKFHAYNWLMRFYKNRLLAINLCRLVLGGQMEKNLRLLASKFELDQSQRRRKSTQVDGQTKRKLNASKTCVDLRVRLARAL